MGLEDLIEVMVLEGASLEAMEDFIDEQHASGEDKAQLWLLAWAGPRRTRRQVMPLIPVHD